MIVAGTLEGVHRSRHAGKSWERTPPEHHQELRNLDSLAVGPRDPRAIYAGTFHLPWENTHGGRTRRSIDDGMIDDSDVMSLPVDRATPRRVYAGACSGIYRSDNHPAGSKKSPDPATFSPDGRESRMRCTGNDLERLCAGVRHSLLDTFPRWH